MIVEYQRPNSEDEAIALLSRSTPKTVLLGGGTILSKTRDELAVVDLQNLGWNQIKSSGDHTFVGSCTTLEALLEHYGVNSAIGKAITIDAGKNIRDMATLGGTLAAIDGRSALMTVLLALGVELVLKPGDMKITLDRWFAERTENKLPKLISEVQFPDVEYAGFESVGRSPLDKPILCCAVAVLSQKRMRIAFGGFGDQPVLAYDAAPMDEYGNAVEKALRDAQDEWASAQYRLEIGRLLAQRLVFRGVKGERE